MNRSSLVLSCEHAGRRVPARYARCFESRRAQAALESHRGWDIGALALARHLQRALRAPLVYTAVSRLLVETNRSVGHPRLFSEFVANLGRAERQLVLERYYVPHRSAVEAAVRARARTRSRVLHVSVHSFTPRLAGEQRHTEVGLLYDPVRPRERAFCRSWKAVLARVQPSWRVRMNYPYRGNADGLTTSLRRAIGERYQGIELEINQALLAGSRARAAAVAAAVTDSLRALLERR